MLSFDIPNLIFTIVNLLVLFVGLRLFLFKPVQKIIAARQEEADRQFQKAAEKQSEADALKEQYEKTLAGADAEKQQLIAEARKTADEEYRRIIEDAEKTAADVKEKAVIEAENRRTQIMKKTEQEITDLVVNAAAKVIGENQGTEADRALYNKFLDKAGDEA